MTRLRRRSAKGCPPAPFAWARHEGDCPAGEASCAEAEPKGPRRVLASGFPKPFPPHTAENPQLTSLTHPQRRS